MPIPTEIDLTIPQVPSDVLARLERTAAKFGQSVPDYILGQATLAAELEEAEDARTLAAYRQSVERSHQGEHSPVDQVFSRLRAKHLSRHS